MPTRLEVFRVNAEILASMNVNVPLIMTEILAGMNVSVPLIMNGLDLQKLACLAERAEAFLTDESITSLVSDGDLMHCPFCPEMSGQGSSIAAQLVWDPHSAHTHHIKCTYLTMRQAYDELIDEGEICDSEE